jgi:hypothetical protein
MAGAGIALLLEDVDIPALYDISKKNQASAQDLVVTSGQKKPKGYSAGEENYKRLIDRDDIAAVLSATPWEWHTPMAVYAMANNDENKEICQYRGAFGHRRVLGTDQNAGADEDTLDDARNWSSHLDNLALLNIIRKRMLADIIYAHCAYLHDCNDIWFFDNKGKLHWSGNYLIKRNANQYPTHGLGPVLASAT